MNDSLSLLSLIWHASLVVQLVMVVLLDWLLKGTYAGLVIESPTAIAAS